MIEGWQGGRVRTALRLALYPAFEPADQRRLQSLNMDAQNVRSSGDFTKAEQLYLSVIRHAEGRPHLASTLGYAYTGLASVHEAQGRHAEAESIYLTQLAQAKAAPQPTTLLHAACVRLAELYQHQGRLAEAERYFKVALAETERPDLWPQWGNRAPLTSTSIRVAQFYASRKNYAAAEALFERALQFLQAEEPGRDSSLPHHLTEVAKLYMDQGKHAEAEECYRRAVAISEKYRGPEDPLTVHYLYLLAASYRITGQRSRAEALYGRALATAEKAAALGSARYQSIWTRLTVKPIVREAGIRSIESSVGVALDLLAECYEGQQKYSEAEQLRRRSLEIVERGWGKLVPRLLAEHLEIYARLLRTLGRNTEAEQAESRARPIRERFPQDRYRCEGRVLSRPGRPTLWWRLSTLMRVLLHPSNTQ